MRVRRLLSVAASAAVVVASGCANGEHAKRAAAAPPARRAALAPADADPGTVLERYYQYIEGDHWPFAYAMLSPRLRATLSEAQFRERYGVVRSPQVLVRQTAGTAITVRLDGVDAAHPSRTLHLGETLKLRWDGEQWTIDALLPRTLNARAGTTD